MGCFPIWDSDELLTQLIQLEYSQQPLFISFIKSLKSPGVCWHLCSTMSTFGSVDRLDIGLYNFIFALYFNDVQLL